MQNKGLKVLLGISIFFSLIFVAGFLLPDTFRAKQKATIPAHYSQVYPYLENLETWQNWTAWSKRKDPSLQIRFPSKTVGEGATQAWQGEVMGKGSLTLTECVPVEGIRYKMNFEDKLQMTGRIHFADTSATQTQLIWTTVGDLGDNPIFRYFGLLMPGMIAPDLQEGLEGLKTIVGQKSDF